MAMIWKFKVFYSHEKELAFLEKMNKKGYRLDKVVGGNLYRFERVEEEHFTISRIVPGKNTRDLIAAAKEKGYSCCLQKTPLGVSILYLDGTRGVSDETFLSGEEDLNVHRLGLRKCYGGGFAYHAVLLGLLLVALAAVQVAAVIKFVLPWAEYGVLPVNSMDVFWEYGCVSVFGMLVTIGFLPPAMTFFRLWRGREKPKNWKGRVLLAQGLCCLLLVPVILVACIPKEVTDDDEPTLEELREQVVLFEDYVHSTEKLGEVYYFYGEYESDLLFEDVKPLLEEKGYRLEDFGSLLEEGDDNLYYWARNDETGATLSLVECTTEEEAKKVYTAAMAGSWAYDYRIEPGYSYTITRMGRMVYGTVYSDDAFSDLMGIYDLPLPEPVPLYKGGTYTYWGFVGFEQAVTTAENMNYTAYGYNELLDEAPIVDCRNYLTPDGRGYLSIVKLTTLEEGFEGELPEDDPVVLYAYQTVAKVLFDLFGHSPESESAKYVMLSEDTFIAGTSYYVDDYIAALETSTVFEAYAPSTEKLGERHYLYAEYESELLFEDIRPKLEELGYSFHDNSHLLEESGDTYYYTAVKDAVVGEKTERAGIFILECETEERAKQVYNRVMARDISHIFAVSPWSSRGVVRMGRMLYGTPFSEQGLTDLLDVYGLPLPAASPLYKGGAYQHEVDVTFEEVVAAAKKAGYTFYDYDESWDNSIYERALDTCHCLVSEDRRGYLLIGKLDCLNPRYLPKLFRIVHDDRGHESMKHVMLSEDTFIAGTSYYVDAFIAELERSTTFEAYAPSAEKIGEQYCLYEEYESDLLLEDVKPFFEERGYDIRDLSKRLDHREDTCYYSVKNEETGVHVVMMECKTEERAKKVFEQIMARDRSHVFLAEPWDSSVVVRVGRTIFGTLYGDQGVQDIFEACNLTLPTPVPLYKGGLYTYGETVTFERALEEAKKEKYELGGRGANFFESTENLPFERVRYIVTPDHKGFLCIGQLARLWAEKLPEKLYVSLDEQGKEAMKYVMLSGGTFIAGTSYYVDAFIAELEE